jgi:hypothetical protein
MRGHVDNMSHVVNIFIHKLHTCVEFFMLPRISFLTLCMCHKRVLRFSSHWTAFLLPYFFRFNMAHVLHVPLHTYTTSHMICMALHVFLHTHVSCIHVAVPAQTPMEALTGAGRELAHTTLCTFRFAKRENRACTRRDAYIVVIRPVYTQCHFADTSNNPLDTLHA